MNRRFSFLMVTILCMMTLLGSVWRSAAQDPATQTLPPITPDSLTTARYLVPEVLNVIPHDPNAYTQGLLLHEGSLFESAGKRGASRLIEVDPATGETIRDISLNEQVFAEGLALVEDRLIQLTWTNQLAYFWDLETFQPLGVYLYEGEGWGLCYDGEFLWMSNGSASLQKRHPNSFKLLEEIPVTLEGAPVPELNELECVGESIYANVYQTNYIMEIEKASGSVSAVIDASDLLTPEEWAELDPSEEVLNGIAYDAENDFFYITGKHWSKLFQVRFVEAE